MADKKFLTEHKLEESYKRFMELCRINESTYFGITEEEEGDDQMPQDPNAQGGDPNAMGGDMQEPPMGGEPPMDGGDPNAQDGGPDAMGGDPNMQGGDAAFDPNVQGGNMQQPPMDGGMGGGPMMGEEPPMEEEEIEEEEEDEVIDVDDITNAQEKTNIKVNKVGRNLGKVDDKIKDIMTMIQSLQTMIDSNNAKIAEFQQEFEKRNPTPVEKMNLRSLDSFPFNQSPTEYWKGKATQPYVSGNRYEAYADNEEPVAKKEYVITNKDVNDFNSSDIKNSFHISDDLRQTIEKIFDI